MHKSDPHPDANSLSYPVFVKPSSGGSSRGTHKVKSPANLSAAINDAFLYDSKVLIETAINGREIECAVLEREGTSYASVVGEIVVNPAAAKSSLASALSIASAEALTPLPT